jgi:hypothetical protein
VGLTCFRAVRIRIAQVWTTNLRPRRVGVGVTDGEKRRAVWDRSRGGRGTARVACATVACLQAGTVRIAAVVVRGAARAAEVLSRARGSFAGGRTPAVRAPDQGQSRSSFRRARRAWVTSLPAVCSSRRCSRLGVGLRQLAFQADQLGPGRQVLHHQRELGPGMVVSEGVVGEVAHACVLPGSD